MATGDKIYLADKETLDHVKQVVDETKVLTENMKGNLSTRPYFTVDELQNDKLVLQTLNMTNTSSNTRLKTIEGSGLLYMAACMILKDPNSNVNAIRFALQVDGQYIMNIAADLLYGSNTLTGYISNNALIQTTNFLSLPGAVYNDKDITVNNDYIAPGALTGKPITTATNTNAIFFTPKPIRFNQSVVITGASSLSNAKVHLMYELD